MSTFGKYSLIWWDYTNSHQRDNIIRYNHTTHLLQLKILQKWYPKNMIVTVDSKPHKIIGYKQLNNTNVTYYLELESPNITNEIIIKHPLLTKPLQSEIIHSTKQTRLI